MVLKHDDLYTMVVSELLFKIWIDTRDTSMLILKKKNGGNLVAHIYLPFFLAIKPVLTRERVNQAEVHSVTSHRKPIAPAHCTDNKGNMPTISIPISILYSVFE